MGSLKKYVTCKMPFLTPPPPPLPPLPHVTLCHFSLQLLSSLCHSIKSDKLWHEIEEDIFIKGGRKGVKLQL